MEMLVYCLSSSYSSVLASISSASSSPSTSAFSLSSRSNCRASSVSSVSVTTFGCGDTETGQTQMLLSKPTRFTTAFSTKSSVSNVSMPEKWEIMACIISHLHLNVEDTSLLFDLLFNDSHGLIEHRKALCALQCGCGHNVTRRGDQVDLRQKQCHSQQVWITRRFLLVLKKSLHLITLKIK